MIQGFSMILSENSIFFFLKNEAVLNLKARKEVNIMKNKKMLLIAGVLAAFLMLAVPFAVVALNDDGTDASTDQSDIDWSAFEGNDSDVTITVTKDTVLSDSVNISPGVRTLIIEEGVELTASSANTDMFIIGQNGVTFNIQNKGKIIGLSDSTNKTTIVWVQKDTTNTNISVKGGYYEGDRPFQINQATEMSIENVDMKCSTAGVWTGNAGVDNLILRNVNINSNYIGLYLGCQKKATLEEVEVTGEIVAIEIKSGNVTITDSSFTSSTFNVTNKAINSNGTGGPISTVFINNNYNHAASADRTFVNIGDDVTIVNNATGNDVKPIIVASGTDDGTVSLNWDGLDEKVYAYYLSGVGGVEDIYINDALAVDTVSKLTSALNDGKDVAIINDLELASPLNITKSVSINGLGHTVNYTGKDRAIDSPKDNPINLTIKNLDITFTYSCERGINFNNSGILTLDNVNVDGGSKVTYALNLPSSSNGAEVTITDSSFTGRIALNVWGAGATITADYSDFISKDPTEEENYSAVKLNNNGETSAEGTTITINGGLISATDENGRPSSATSNATHSGKIIISSTTVVNGSARTVVAIHTYPGYDEFYSFASIQDFIEWFNDADNKETDGNVELIADVVLTDDLIIKSDSKQIQLIGSEYTITVSEGVTFRVEEGATLDISNTTVINEGLLVIDGDITNSNGSSQAEFTGNGIVAGIGAENVPGLEDKVQTGTTVNWDDSSVIVSDSNSVLISNGETTDRYVEVQLRDDADSLMAVQFPTGTIFGGNSAVSINETDPVSELYDIIYDVSFYGIDLPPNGEVSIRLPIYEVGEVSIYYIDDNGMPTEYQSWVSQDAEGTYVYFNTTHNSLYAVVYDDTGSSSGGVIAPGIGNVPEKSSEGFSTADYATMAGIVIAVVMLIGLVCIVRRN